MIVKLNQLDPEKKKKLISMTKFLFVKNMLEFVIIITSLLAVILLWSWLVLVDEFQDLSESALLLSRGFSSQNKEIREVNKSIKMLDLSSKGYLAMTPKILELFQNLPPNIKLKSVDLVRCANDLLLIGTATTRQALLDYKKTLENMSWIVSLDSPTSQLLQKENVDFEIEAKLTDFNLLPSCAKTAPKPANAANTDAL